MELKPLKGVFPLMPFVLDQDQELDLHGLTKNIEIYERAGVHGYVAFGCMGECYASSFDEFRRVVDTAVEATRNTACATSTRRTDAMNTNAPMSALVSCSS